MSIMSDVFKFLLCLVIFFVIPVNANSSEEDEYDSDEEDERLFSSSVGGAGGGSCVPIPLGGAEWILSVMNSDYGWGDETHRAVVALALNGWRGVRAGDRRQMELQLDVEITKSLLRNSIRPVHPNDLVLFVHALIATERNPRDFYGRDLVGLLLDIAATARYDVHPVLLLALCNSNAADHRHLHYAKSILQTMLSRKSIDLLALALKAYSCMKTLGLEVDLVLIQEVVDTLLADQQGDGSFGNLYRTSLIVQAVSAAKGVDDEDRDMKAAFDFLKLQSTVNPNMVSTYLIQLALHCRKFPFIKKLHPDLSLEPVPVKRDDGHYVQYTIKVGKKAEAYFTITVKVPQNATFFDVMLISARHDSKFNFSYYLDKDDRPNVYSISGVPNDAEGNQYWRLCRQSDVNHDRHIYKMETLEYSPVLLTPSKDDHLIYWFKDSDCVDNS